MGAVLSRKVVTTDASLASWGGAHEGQCARGSWSAGFSRIHIILSEFSAFFLSLKCFLPFLKDYHVLVQTNNTTTVAYISQQGGVRSHRLTRWHTD